MFPTGIEVQGPLSFEQSQLAGIWDSLSALAQYRPRLAELWERRLREWAPGQRHIVVDGQPVDPNANAAGVDTRSSDPPQQSIVPNLILPCSGGGRLASHSAATPVNDLPSGLTCSVAYGTPSLIRSTRRSI